MNDEYWRAIVACDPAYDGVFYYGLVTTGIYCRPSCKSRTPNRPNVRIYRDANSPKADGLRPCKRCRPEQFAPEPPDKELADRLALLIDEQFREPLTLTDMAERLYISPFYLQKCFTRVRGVSPARYVLLQRLEAAKRLLAETDDSMTAVALSVGFRSGAYFASVFQKETGLRPSAYRQRVAGLPQNTKVQAAGRTAVQPASPRS